nr:immunoglobulin light chain junction region [Macaca mulatta]
CFQYTHIPYSF